MNRSIGALAVAAALATALAISPSVGANGGTARATLRNAAGADIGSVKFITSRSATEVRVVLKPGSSVATAYHGFHIHANADGAGCIADPALASSTWFTAVGGHWKDGTQTHGQHLGDLASVFVNADGSSSMRFTIDRFAVWQLAGRAVVLHAGPDNFGNVPVGANPDQYTANSTDATTKTQNTGNAGDRIACGIIAAS